jgi:hypothetical protein
MAMVGREAPPVTAVSTRGKAFWANGGYLLLNGEWSFQPKSRGNLRAKLAISAIWAFRLLGIDAKRSLRIAGSLKAAWSFSSDLFERLLHQ